MMSIQASLYTDCTKCRGLCCRALYFSRLDGFPHDKAPGVACRYLCDDYQCSIYHELKQKGLKGCQNYDCLGAGQAAVQKDTPTDTDLFAVYLKLYPIHQMLWYLMEAVQMKETITFQPELQGHIRTLNSLRNQAWQNLLHANLDSLHEQTNRMLKRTIQQKQLQNHGLGDHLIGRRFTGQALRNTDFTMKPLLGADFSNCDLRGSCFLGCDLRDCTIAGSDLRGCFFLTQMQINSARGNMLTKLPENLKRPAHWETAEHVDKSKKKSCR